MNDSVEGAVGGQGMAPGDDFVRWLGQQLDERGWKPAELARRGDLTSTQIGRVMNGERNPGLDFYRGVARAFRMPLEDVLRAGGILPAVTASDRTVARIVGILNEQPPAVRSMVLRVIEVILGITPAEPEEVGGADEESERRELRRQLDRLLGSIPEERLREVVPVLRKLASGQIEIDASGYVRTPGSRRSRHNQTTRTPH